MSFPMVNGMLMDTEEEMKSRPIAIARGLRSGLASATIFLNDDAVCDALASPTRNDEGKIRESIDTDGRGEGDSMDARVFEEGSRVEYALDRAGGGRRCTTCPVQIDAFLL